MDNPWYAVQCKANQDARAEIELGRQGFVTFRPKLEVRRRRSARVESLFPRYLFLRLGEVVDSFASVRSTRGVLRMVGWSGLVPVVPDMVIHKLMECCDELGVMRKPEAHLKLGQQVRVTDGPLHDLTGTLLKCSGEERVVVLMTLLQREQRIELPVELVSPV